jgi:hypothetical protein
MKIKLKTPVGWMAKNTTAICVAVTRDGKPLEMSFEKEYEVTLSEYNKILAEFGDSCLSLVDDKQVAKVK